MSSVLKKFAKLLAYKEATKTVYNSRRVILIVLASCVMLIVGAISALFAGPTSLDGCIKNYFKAKYSNYSQEQINNIIDDAELLRTYIKRVGFDEYTSQMIGIDKKTVLRILDAVAEYNETMNKQFTVEYKYRVEKVKIGEEFPTMDTQATGIITGDTEGIEGYEVSYKEDSTTISRKNIENQVLVYGSSQSIFKVRWQPIMALCCMKIVENSPNWGRYTIEDGVISQDDSIPNYYLSDAEIDEIIQIFLYKYEYVRDIQKDEEFGACEFDDFLKFNSYGFDLAYSDYKEEDGYRYRETRRIPMIAPKRIYNSYVTYDYIYDNVDVWELGSVGDVLSKRKITIKPQSLIDAMKNEVSMFDESWFLYCLELLPLTEDLCGYYEGIFEDAVKYSYETQDEVVGASRRAFVYGNAYLGAAIERPGEGIIIPLYYGDWTDSRGTQIYLEPGDWIIEEGKNYGSYYVEPEAITSLALAVDVVGEVMYSDGTLSGEYMFADLSSMVKLVDYCYENYPNWPLFLVEGNLTAEQKNNILETRKQTLAQCLYDFQCSHHCSISGFFGIMKQEGTLQSTWTSRRWNFFNITRGDLSIPGIVNSDGEVTAFRDYKEWCKNETATGYKDPVINAFNKQMEWIWDNYWNNGQDTYFSMIFNGYNINDPNSWLKINHSYCPPWDDVSMPFSANSHVGSSYFWKSAGPGHRGWVNGCAIAKRAFMAAMREEPTISTKPNPNPTVSSDTYGDFHFKELKTQVVE